MSNLSIFNSYTRTKEKFVPITPGFIGMYVCGATVYDLCHAGNARTIANFDTIVRFLRFIGYKVKFVRNITDIDDKIIKRANENGEKFTDLTARMTAEMHKDFARLHVLPPDVEPRASEFIGEIIAMCQTLEEKGFAYVNSDGDLLFKVKQYHDYGKLSKQNLDQLVAGLRTEISQNKETSLDFVLWKKAKPGEPSWQSPWGEGRPGWHIECSAMNLKELGANFDIHGGGSDLMFPHHENERAQSCCATGGHFARYWMHSGMLQINKEKMSKSLGNFFTLRTLLDTYEPEAVRLFLVGNHYRSTLNFTTENLEIAEKSLARLYTAVRGYADQALDKIYNLADLIAYQDNPYLQRFVTSMEDDFNAPEAMASLFDLARDINSATDESYKTSQAFLLRVLANTMGFMYQSTAEFFNQSDALEVDPQYIDSLIEQRATARANKDWVTADKVRDELNRLQIVVEDTVDGTVWKVKK